jgi:hypothetical protein
MYQPRDGLCENYVVDNVWKTLDWSFANIIHCERILLRIVLDGFELVADGLSKLVTKPSRRSSYQRNASWRSPRAASRICSGRIS